MNTYEVEDLIRSWLRAVAYTTPYRIAELDMRIHSAGCDVQDGDFIVVDIMAPDDSNPIACNVYKNVASIKFTGTKLSSVQQSEMLHNISLYWDRLT